MIKGLMGLDKSQVPSLIRYAASTTEKFFKRDLYIQAGFTTFDVMVVGAAGGFSGRCVSNADNITYEAGPGGGGFMRCSGLLSDLPASVGVRPGVKGVDGTDAGDNDYGENGWEGQRSWFWHIEAEGGWGAWGGSVDRMSGGTSWQNAEGGDGGSAWSDYPGDEGADPGLGGPNNGGPGNLSLAPIANVIAAGGGGGGGQARTKINGVTQDAAGTGGAGASGTNPDYLSPGGASVSSMGGPGGGVNLKPITGVDEYYGTRVPGGSPDGIVVLKLA